MNAKYEAELKEYKGFGAEIIESLELNYQTAMFNDELELAYNTLGDMMRFKLIDTDDPRITKKNKAYTAGGVEPDHRFRLDYRKEIGFVPDWLYGNYNGVHSFNIDSFEHMGKRVEGNYEGDTVFSSHAVKILVKAATTTKQVENMLDEAGRIYKENTGKGLNTSDLKTMCKEGVYRVFQVSIDGPCISRYQTIAVVIVVMGDDGIKARVIPNYEAMMNNWIDIQGTVNGLATTLSKMFSNEVKVSMVYDSKKAIESQKGLVEATKVK